MVGTCQVPNLVLGNGNRTAIQTSQNPNPLWNFSSSRGYRKWIKRWVNYLLVINKVKHGWGYTEDYRVGELTEVTFCVKT